MFIAALTIARPHPGSAAATYNSRVREHVLPNGLKLIVLEDHKAPEATFQVWYRVGSRNEELGKTGLSHLLEHLMFKGTDKIAPEEYSKIIQRNGGNENAFTGDDSTTYFATLASDRVNVVIDLEADRMQNLKFDDAQFTPEHKVVMEERRLRTDDSPMSALFELLSSTAYVAHPYAWPVIGWMSDLSQATREDALAHYKLYYHPSNAFVVAVGDFSADDLIAKVESTFGPIAAGPQPPPMRAKEPEQQGERRSVLRREAQLPFVALAYHVPNLRSPDGAVLEVLSAVLAGGKSSRLHKKLVYEKRLAREAGAQYEYTSVDPGMFALYAQPLPGKSAAQLEKEIEAEIDLVRKAEVSERELQKAKNGIEAGFVLSQDSLFYEALLLGQYEVAGDWKRIDDYLPAIRAVTTDDLQRVASQYLVPTNRSVATLDPIPPPPGKMTRPERAPQGMVH
ncbi:MAG: insulinase family protein [Deltaproteobacteria bacterium]|nr:insulinase family protein [Deltaproteobacteria bacterium]